MAIGIGNAKTIFFGEHFVVYGCPAIGFGLDKKIQIEVKKSSCFKFGFDANENVRKVIEILKKSLGVGNFIIRVKNSEIPIASGLGSGAAFSVAAIRAISNEFNLKLTNRDVCSLAFKAETVFHGTPSGIDNTLATFGGAILFQKRPAGNLIQPIKIGAPLHLVLIDSGVKAETKSLINKVRVFKERNEAVFAKLTDAEVKIVELAQAAIENGDFCKLGSLMDANHGLLNTIGVSHIENEKIISIARKNGAMGAKLVGAGGGGFCMALAKDKASALIIMAIIEKEYQCFYNLIPSV